MNTILVPVIGMSVIGLFWAIVVVVVNKKFHVEENPLIEQVIGCLPGVNCGACGFAGCGALGEAIVEQNVDPTVCPVNEDTNIENIGKLLGREVSAKGIKRVAKLHCSGTHANVEDRANYQGAETCMAEHITNGGGKACLYGCLGLGDCIKVCPFDAIVMQENGLPAVNAEKCTACGKCVDACPRNLFQLTPIDQPIFILCSSHDSGAITKKACKVGCIACSICDKKVDATVFKITDNLATVDYEAAKQAAKEKLQEAVDKCPQHIITLR